MWRASTVNGAGGIRTPVTRKGKTVFKAITDIGRSLRFTMSLEQVTVRSRNHVQKSQTPFRPARLWNNFLDT